MKSKRASVGNFISNYYTLIFLAIILGVFIFTSPFIKSAVKPETSSTEAFQLNDYKSLFFLANEKGLKDGGYLENDTFFYYLDSSEGYPIFFAFDNNVLYFYIGSKSFHLEDITLSYEASPKAYYINSILVNEATYVRISQLFAEGIKQKSSEEQLLMLKSHLTEVSYEK